MLLVMVFDQATKSHYYRSCYQTVHVVKKLTMLFWKNVEDSGTLNQKSGSMLQAVLMEVF